MFISGFSCMMLWDSSQNLSLEMLSKSKNGYRNQSQRNKDMNESLPLLMQFGFPCVFNMLPLFRHFSFGCFNLVVLCSSISKHQ